MLKTLISFCRFLLFWTLFGVFTRTAFVLYFKDNLRGVSAGEVLQAYLYGMRMDASAAGYIAVIPLLVFGIGWFFKKHIKPVWLRVYVYTVLFLIALIAIVNLNIFREWGTKVTYRVFANFFDAPKEGLASSSSSPIALSLSIGIGLLVTGALLSEYIIDYKFRKPSVPFIAKPLIFVVLFGLNLVVIRGGLQLAPMSQSNAYFSDKPILNQCALNTEWNLLQNTTESVQNPENPYLFMPADKAAALVDSMYAVKKDTTEMLLTTTRPNVVIFQLESFTADLIASLGGEKGDAPNFEQFIKQGVLFDSIYATSDRTDKGMIGIMSAFPSQALRTIVIDNARQEHLPALSSVFADEHYHTSYFYGGESEFMNFRAYLLSHHIKEIVDKQNFAAKEMNSKWGAHDDVLLKRNVQYLTGQQQPFFSYVQTLSNHEPFEVPVKPHFPGEDLPNKFRSTAYYTDASLKEYFDLAKKQPWYKNTLFVLIADHGHRLPLDHSEPYNPRKYHIPMLFFGDVIKPAYRGKHINKLGGQTDMAATLLAQLNIPHKQFKWSKNLLNPYSKPFAFFDWDNGMGFKTPQQAVTYDNAGKRISYVENRKLPQATIDSTLLYGKAFLQQVFTEYMKY
ncbi:alkaline phosphatase family protein [Mucilaginibacter terrenus]|uniref:Alkaline phosphatase family protein n=1 Tax=Mucilaginibacter terrenus TaxID=2482727 RepID=A0A3E2NR50_9SPHI|nr:alkaline phosphatase family protein [Mucilaginibacter terrenus]RFZ83467.1 alkaline phosphatase family protein [Mucilaginibacter terrenus]